MDKKNTIIGISLLVAGFVLMYTTKPEAPPPSESPEQASELAPATPETADSPSRSLPSSLPGHASVEENIAKQGEIIESLETELAVFRFTNYGGAIKEVVLKDHLKERGKEDPYVMNELRYAPALTFNTFLGGNKSTVYEFIPTTDGSIAFRALLGDKLEVIRRYTPSSAEDKSAPYSIDHSIELRNLSDQPLQVSDASINIGTVAPAGAENRQAQLQQTFGYYDGEDVEFYDQSDFTGGGFLFFSKDPKDLVEQTVKTEWASVKNQFFITLLTPEDPGVGFAARPVDFPALDKDGHPKVGLTADLKLGSFAIEPRATVTKSFHFYAGPKEHGRLAALDKKQEKAMQFGFFGAISKTLLLIMNGLHGLVGNWGVAIILLTLIVRTVLFPITFVSMKSMRRMSKVAEPMKALKEKFPDNPQKQQQLMMQLYKANKINPLSGCLPMLLQIPVFFGLFYMLRSAAELRFADFLWIQDLSKPDTLTTLHNVPFLGELPLNALPFVWLVSLAWQMWTMPTPQGADNPQMKMMKYMPFIFFPFTYTFASGLVLYWTVSNFFTIAQQQLTKKGADDFEVILPPEFKKALEGGQNKGKRAKKN